MDSRQAVDAPDLRLDRLERRLVDEVGLVQHDDIGKRDLVLRFGAVLEPGRQV